MNLTKLIVLVVVIGGIVAGVMYWKGALKVDSQGNVSVNNGGMTGEMNPYTAADGYFMSFKYDDALAAYRKALDKDPGSHDAPVAMFRIGKCLENLNKNSEALAAYREFVAKWPNDANVNPAGKRIDYLTSTGVK